MMPAGPGTHGSLVGNAGNAVAFSMATAYRDRKVPVDLGQALLEAFLTNERVNQVLLDLLDPAIWRQSPPCSKRRNIATTFAHIHNVRRMRLVMSDKEAPHPPKLDRARVTMDEARAGLAKSAFAFADLIERVVAGGGHVKGFRPDVVALVCAAITHEAHHRGQICHWSRELGSPIGAEEQLQLWEWDKRWKDVVGRA